MSEPKFIPVQINLTPKQIEYLEQIRQLDGIARGPYIRALLKRDMERGGVILSNFEMTTEQTVTTSTLRKKVVSRQQVEPQRQELMQELKQVLEARKKKIEPVVVL